MGNIPTPPSLPSRIGPNSRRPAKSAADHIQEMRNKKNTTAADAHQSHQDYADALALVQGDQNSYLQGVDTTLNALTAYLGGVGIVLPEITILVPNSTVTNISFPTGLPTGQTVLLPLTLVVDATGGGQVTWAAGPPGFKGVTSDTIDNNPSANGLLNVYLFILRADGNLWLMSSNLGLVI